MGRRRKSKTVLPSTVVVMLLLVLAVAHPQQFLKSNPHSGTPASTTEKQAAIKDVTAEKLVKMDFHSGESPIVTVNNNKSTLQMNAWKKNTVVYSPLDNLNRTSSPNTGYLEQRNVVNDEQRTRQYVQPTAWHQKKDNGEAIINRGHLIAYSISGGIAQDGDYNQTRESGDQNNPKNLFTQTAFSNQRLQTIYEKKIREALRNGHRVIYQAQPLFRGQELMARGIHLQALSDDGSLNFNVYLFNVQPRYIFDYQSGRSTKDASFQVALPENLKS
ncbi:DNA/RNA non-specific endonuclease [Liquorilactobacillus capillatus]|uniref:DNA RNA non-specific endonuclease n=1 Tax=Liquorilactobacillus capillatus DSM 19910 TaxID=1423731 RepID=A0A0R1M943_9LACO|nr:DNA/RNA non-specific endonuclease [Liquorilactobacillus capillatus]KRL00579.1 DNA RNA non-specific endonuclease [Liquorilactobacillus capillatus DSM 19910]